MVTPHAMHTTTALTSTKLLVAGGCTTPPNSGGNNACTVGQNANDAKQAEVITLSSSTSGTTSSTSNLMKAQHYQHTATVFDTTNGKVLIAGGAATVGGSGQNVAEFFDGTKFLCIGADTAGVTCLTPQTLTHVRAQHAALLLPSTAPSSNAACASCSAVALFGGLGSGAAATNTIEIFDPTFVNTGLTPGKFTNSTTLGAARFDLTASQLAGAGRILVAGGFSSGTTAATPTNLDLFDVSACATTVPLTCTLTGVANPTNMDNLATARGGHTATVIFDTTVLIAGGVASTSSAELFTSSQ
jgi:hypothetical protein